MWETLSLPWQACLEQAWEAYCSGSLPIGAVIVDQNEEIIVRARNHRYENTNLPFGSNNQEIMHAELLAILAMNDRQVPRGTAELYTTMEPCPMCLGTWYMSNMRILYYAARDPFAGSVNLLETTWYLSRKGKQAHGPTDPDLEKILIALNVETEIRVRGRFSKALKSRWEPELTTSIKVGETLLDDLHLTSLREHRTPVSEVIDYLACQLQNPTKDEYK